MLVRVRSAVKFGWYGKRRRYAGDEFILKDGDKLGAWMEPVEPIRAKEEPLEVAAPKRRGRPPKQATEGA